MRHGIPALIMILSWSFSCRGPQSETSGDLSLSPSNMSASPASPGLGSDSVDKPQGSLTIPVSPGALKVAFVARPRAFLRIGPGTQFEVFDQVLTRGSILAIQAEMGVWRKVHALMTGQVGWIHEGALGPVRLNGRKMQIDPRFYPTVATLKSISTVESFPERHRITTSLPKGAVLTALRSNQDGYLVWDDHSKTIIWLSRKDAQ